MGLQGLCPCFCSFPCCCVFIFKHKNNLICYFRSFISPCFAWKRYWISVKPPTAFLKVSSSWILHLNEKFENQRKHHLQVPVSQVKDTNIASLSSLIDIDPGFIVVAFFLSFSMLCLCAVCVFIWGFSVLNQIQK